MVDDEEDFLTLMSARLESWGYAVVKATSGGEALSILKREKFDLIILDYLMPQMDGIATLEKIRQTNKTVPVIVFTAHPEMHVIKGSKALGINAFIPKISVWSDGQDALKAALGLIEKGLHQKNPRRGDGEANLGG